MLSYILALICGIAVLFVDQLTKYLVISNFTLGQSTDMINGLLNLVYIHNRGGAWGMLSGKTWFLIVLTALIMLICVIVIIKCYKKSKLLFWALCLVLSGGLGNMIDRIFRNGNVVDFLQFDFWQSFPVFNVADCAIVIGAGLLLLYFVIDTVREIGSKRNTVDLQDENARD